MNRLACNDHATCRSEEAVFVSLGLAGVPMVALVAAQMADFVVSSDHIPAALSGRKESLANVQPADIGRSVTTNAAKPTSYPANPHTAWLVRV